MKIVLFTHPSFLVSQSMPRFAFMLKSNLSDRGHKVDVWSPRGFLINLSFANSTRKWFGYFDQYIIFPIVVFFKVKIESRDTLFVFADQALGPYVPLVKNRAHVIHCHDFIALRSSLGEISSQSTGWSGKLYQKFIRNGFSKGKHFISVSKKTEEDLFRFHKGEIKSSLVCYNGFNFDVKVIDKNTARKIMSHELGIDLYSGYIMHIGGNQFYKNRVGVIEIYNSFRDNHFLHLPLILIGTLPDDEILFVYNNSKYKSDIHFITNFSDTYKNEAYSAASCLLFPSIEEGFGWPIAEAMAAGCLVITTNKAPMNEIGGEAAFYIPEKPQEAKEIEDWSKVCAAQINLVLELNASQKEEIIKKGLQHVNEFDTIKAMDKIETIYKKIESLNYNDSILEYKGN